MLAVVVILLVFTQTGKEEKLNVDITNKQMPMDNVHKNLTNGSMNNPNIAKISEEVKQKLEALKKDVEANPKDTLKMREYAKLLVVAHQPEEALVYYKKILEKDKSRKDIYFAMTFVYYSTRNLAKAEEVTLQMQKLFPNDPMVNYNVGVIEVNKGNKGKAREIWTKLIKDFPTDKTAELAKNSLKKL